MERRLRKTVLREIGRVGPGRGRHFSIGATTAGKYNGESGSPGRAAVTQQRALNHHFRHDIRGGRRQITRCDLCAPESYVLDGWKIRHAAPLSRTSRTILTDLATLRLELIDEADAGASGQEALHAAGPVSGPYLARTAVIRRRSARSYAIPEHTLSRAIARTTTL